MVHLTRGTVRMICLDLDGTLFTPRKEISGRSRKAIKDVWIWGWKSCW